MPTNTAMELLNAYKLKRQQNPSAERSTLFKYMLWDRFKGKMIMDSELDEMATSSSNLNELSLKVLAREKPHLVAGSLEDDAREAIDKFFSMNYSDSL